MKPRWKQKGTIEGMKERERVNPRDRKLKARESDQRVLTEKTALCLQNNVCLFYRHSLVYQICQCSMDIVSLSVFFYVTELARETGFIASLQPQAASSGEPQLQVKMPCPRGGLPQLHYKFKPMKGDEG
ncbi:unnamed protein product [Lepidochelys kempii]